METTNIYKTSLIDLQGEQFILHPLKAMFWPKEKTLILADLHLGKSQHFRKNGMAVPVGMSEANFQNLSNLILQFAPQRILILGDLFHSDHNIIWDLFCAYCDQYAHIEFQLVPGNHDVLPEEKYTSSPLTMLPEEYDLGPFIFSHHPLDSFDSDKMNVCGHVHPGVRLEGKGRQRMRLSCFYIHENQCILPAFGAFTGLYMMQPDETSRVYGVAEQSIYELTCD